MTGREPAVVPRAEAVMHAKEAGVTLADLRRWINRGKITAYPGGVDLWELLDWLDNRRDTRKIRYPAT